MRTNGLTNTVAKKSYWLTSTRGVRYESDQKGTLGGYRKLRLYGRLDCANALRHIANGHYVKERVFFADEATAIAAGYRPCARCMAKEFGSWKARSALKGAPDARNS